MQQATEAAAATASGTLHSDSAIVSNAQEITAAWTRYAKPEPVDRNLTRGAVHPLVGGHALARRRINVLWAVLQS
jgi:hypothetical protein